MRGLILIGAIGLAGCASASGEQAPAWFAEHEAGIANTYPDLRDVPRSADTNTNSAHWNAMERELVALGESVKNNRRAEPATATISPNAILDKAREDLEATRRAHDPNE
jgi:hypothetical protein